jgi:hypothetical protein
MSTAMKAGLPLDPLAATIHLRIEELRTDADAHRAHRATGNGTRARLTWPSAVAAALRESVTRATTGRSRQACATC